MLKGVGHLHPLWTPTYLRLSRKPQFVGFFFFLKPSLRTNKFDNRIQWNFPLRIYSYSYSVKNSCYTGLPWRQGCQEAPWHRGGVSMVGRGRLWQTRLTFGRTTPRASPRNHHDRDTAQGGLGPETFSRGKKDWCCELYGRNGWNYFYMHAYVMMIAWATKYYFTLSRLRLVMSCHDTFVTTEII